MGYNIGREEVGLYGSKPLELPRPELYVVLSRCRDNTIYSDISMALAVISLR